MTPFSAITEIAGRLLRLLSNSPSSLDGPHGQYARTAFFSLTSPYGFPAQPAQRASRKLLSTRQIDVNVSMERSHSM